MKCDGIISSVHPAVDAVGVWCCSKCGFITSKNGDHDVDVDLELVVDEGKKHRLFNQLSALRFLMVFSRETAYGGVWTEGSSQGHCAVAAIIVRYIFGGNLVSTIINGESHWFNQLGNLYIDITADQYGPDKVMIEEHLYPTLIRERFDNDIKEETMERVRKLIQNSFRGSF